MAESVKLNLGAGAQRLPGFVSCDLANNWTNVQPDVVCDVTGPLPFPNDHADEVHAYHVFEHIQRWLAEDVLKEWTRVLKPGGLLVLEMPCLDKIVQIFAMDRIRQVKSDIRLTVWGLYGDPKYKSEEMVHKWCWSAQELADVLFSVGMEDVRLEEPQTHQKIRDMRMTAKKP